MMKVVNLWYTLVMHVLLKNQIVSFTQKMYIVQIKLDSQLLKENLNLKSWNPKVAKDLTPFSSSTAFVCKLRIASVFW